MAYRPLINPTEGERAPLLQPVPSSSTTSAPPSKHAPAPTAPSSSFSKGPPPEMEQSDAASSPQLRWIPVGDVTMAPNCQPVNDREALISDITRLVNGGRGLPCSTAAAGGVVIPMGSIGFIRNNGELFVVGPGRWIAWSLFSTWEPETYALSENVISHKNVSIVRVPRGSLGLATFQGNPVVLGAGLHVYNNNLFAFRESVPENQPYIRHGTAHLLRVPTGSVAKVRDGVQCALIPEGVHAILSATFSFDGMESLNSEVIIHGTITRYRVQRGEVALLWHDNIPIVNDVPGIYMLTSSNVKWVRTASATESVLQLGSKKRIIVDEGAVGILYNAGKLEVLDPGTHFFDSPVVKFDSFLSVRQREICLAQTRDKVIRCETQDLVEVGILADVFYRVIDPRKAIIRVGTEEQLGKLVKDNAVGTLQSIIRSSNLRNVAQSSRHATSSAKGKEEFVDGDGKKFLDSMHDQFIEKLHGAFLELYGIEITNIRVEDFRILNQELAKNISEQAILTAKTQTNLTNLDGQNRIELATQERQSKVQSMVADTEAYKVAAANKAKNDALLADAQTEAEALRIRSNAQAAAQALDNKVRLDYIQSLREVLGAEGAVQLLAMQEWSKIAQSSLAGTQKIIYSPFDSKTNPVAFGSSPMQFLEQLKQGGAAAPREK